MLTSNGPKDNSRRRGMPKQWKDERRAAAEARQTAYNKLTVKQKLDKLDAGGYKATKQRGKLNALVSKT